jgi:tetratricopeptide (TPR) repeat protein
MRREALAEYRLGVQRLEAGAYDQAAAAFLRAIIHNRNLPIAYYGLGQAYAARQRYDDAIVAYVYAIDSLSAANLYEEDRQPSLQQHRSDLTIREVRAAAAPLVAGTDPQSGIASAADRVTRAARLQGRSFEADIALALGNALFHAGRLSEAEGEWRRAVELRPDLGEAWNNLAALYLQTGFKAPAEEAVSAAERAGYRVSPELQEDILRMP